MAKKNKVKEIKNLIRKLQKYDETEHFLENKNDGNEKGIKEICDKLINIGKPAIPYLVNLLESSILGEHVKEALKKFGPVCIPMVIEKVKYRISHPLKGKNAFHTLTMFPLSTIAEIKCDKSAKFLNNLLDDYMLEIPDEVFDPGEYDWKYRNVDFFHLLDCMVRQQDKRAIPHIKKARDFFPKVYTDHIVCQLAIDRIKKGEIETCLPLEALDIAFPGFI